MGAHTAPLDVRLGKEIELYRVVGRHEKQILRGVNRALSKVEIDDSPSMGGLYIHLCHSLEGVRVNGTGKPTSVVRVVKDLREIGEEIAEHIKQVQKVQRLLEQQRQYILKHFKTCSACHGKQGDGYELQDELPMSERKQHEHGWEDCGKCGGAGMT